MARCPALTIDFLWRLGSRKRAEYREEHPTNTRNITKKISMICANMSIVTVEEGSILKSALIHTAQITVFIFLVSAGIGFLVETDRDRKRLEALL